MWIRAMLVVVLVCLLIPRFLKLLQMSRKYPAGPPALLIVVKFIKAGFRIPPDMLAEITKEYGSIYTLWRLSFPVVIISGFEAVKEALVKHSEEFSGRHLTPFYDAATHGKGIVMSNGHNWKQQRKFGIVTLRKLGMGKKGMQNQMEDEARQLVKTFARTKGQPTDPSLPIFNSVSNVICALVFGHRYSVEDEKFLKLTEAVKYLVRFGGSFFHLTYEVFPWLMKRIKWPYKKAFACVDLLFQHGKKETELHRAQLEVHDPRDFIDYYLLQMETSKNDPTSTYDEANLCQCICDLFFAGTDSTANILIWGLLLLAVHPDIQEKVQKELEDTFGSSQIVSYQDHNKVPYTVAVIHEIQRFKCVILSGNPRQCVKDVTVLGSFIPKGTTIVPDVHSIIYDPTTWETPRKFNPNHFLDKDGKFVDREELLLFGMGARVCLGKELAKMELFTFFTSLLRAFTLKLPEGATANLEPQYGMLLSPRPYKICAVPRFSEP